MNSKFNDLIFSDEMFEANMKLDKNNMVKEYIITKI